MRTLLTDYRRGLIAIWQIAIILVSFVAAYLLRFDFSIPVEELDEMYRGLGIALVVKVSVFYFYGLHRGWWQFVGMADLARLVVANVVASAGFTAITLGFIGRPFPRSIYVIDFILCFLISSGSRFAVRLYNEAILGELRSGGEKGVLIYGGGSAGMTLIREFKNNPSLGTVVGLIDDNRSKRKAVLMGVRVLGTGREIPQIVDRYRNQIPRIEEIIIAMPSASGRQMGEALANSRAAGVPCRTIPGFGELLTNKVLSAQIRDVSVGDLLGRQPVQLDESRIRVKVTGRSVLVTGAAGSIGSELCRQVGSYRPKVLVAMDQAESDLYKIHLELKEKHNDLEVIAELGDIRDEQRVDEIVRKHQIESLFHAAAYKHVPMMESHICEAIRNNVIGTWNVARAAYRNSVADFLMISSDKAVNPTNIMGTTKRVAELIVGAMPRNRTKFVSVRFGNVLGSNGSVVPRFQQQIAAGGPVTVTHPEVRRYFMTIREAVQLVLQASTMGRGTEIFVLDMGEPVRIVDLASNMIRLAGKIPDRDIEIRFVGLRPGEKLFEELITSGENVMPTYHEKIKIFQGSGANRDIIDPWLLEMEDLLTTRDDDALVAHLKKLVPEYKPRTGREDEKAEVVTDPPGHGLSRRLSETEGLRF